MTEDEGGTGTINVLLADDGTPKVSDFGLARQQGEGAGLTQTGMAIGTPAWSECSA